MEHQPRNTAEGLQPIETQRIDYVEPLTTGDQTSTNAHMKEPRILLERLEEEDSSNSDESKTLQELRKSNLWRRKNKSKRQPRQYPRPWKTLIIRAGPISGICSMLLVIASMLSCLGILLGSNGAAVSRWAVQPSEYLAVFTAIANLATRYACIQGIIIAWWSRALRGTTLSDMHWDWRAGSTLIGAITSGRRMGWFGLACIMSTLVTIDGPLFGQPSKYLVPYCSSQHPFQFNLYIDTALIIQLLGTSIVPVPITGEFLTLDVTMVAMIPRTYGGLWTNWTASAGVPYHFSASFNSTFPTINGSTSNDVFPLGTTKANAPVFKRMAKQYYENAPFSGVMDGCKGSCKAKLIAPALQTTCETRQVPVNYSQPYDAKDYQGVLNLDYAPPLEKDVFIATATLNEQVNETIDLIAGWSSTHDCAGMFNYHVCNLVSAVGEYDVSVDNNRMTIDDPIHPRILALANNTKADLSPRTPASDHSSTLGSLIYFFRNIWETNVSLFTVGGELRGMESGSGIFRRYETHLTAACSSYLDPIDDMLAFLNERMVLMGAEAARLSPSYLETRMDPGWPVKTTTVGTVVGNHNVYKSEFRFFIAAALVELACILLVAPTYWGWWHFGRPCSFSPLELAKAFESPLLTDVNSNSSGRDLAMRVGEVRVRYGAISQHRTAEISKLTFANPDLVDKPEKGKIFDS